MKTKNRNVYLDWFKLLLAFFVVCIHFLGDSPIQPLFRIAVPFFFMISGYYCYKKDKDKEVISAKKLLRSTFLYLAIGLVFYFLYYGFVNFVKGGDFLTYINGVFYDNFFLRFFIYNTSPVQSASHIWFLIALFIIACIHYFLVKFDLKYLYYFIVPFCLIIFFAVTIVLPVFNRGVVDPLLLEVYRNAIFFGLPLFAWDI